MKAQFVYERISFERGKNPMDTLEVGDVRGRELRAMSDEDLKDLTIGHNLSDEVVKEVIDVLKERYPGQTKKDLRDEIKEWKTMRSPHSSTTKAKKDLIAYWINRDRIDKLEKWKYHIKKRGVDVDIEFSDFQIRNMKPKYFSPEVLQWLLDNLSDKFLFDRYSATGMIMFADREDLVPLIKIVLDNWTQWNDLQARVDSKEEWEKAIIRGLQRRDDLSSREIRSIMRKAKR